MMNLFEKEEDLIPELYNYIYKDNKLNFYYINHPLIINMFYDKKQNAFINKQYASKKAYIDECYNSKNWNSYLWMHERPYRMAKFVEICHQLNDQEYWSILGNVWVDSENLWQNKNIIKILLSSDRPNKEKIMEEAELKFLNSLPEELVIYRGHGTNNKSGNSWTLSPWKAKWFSKRLNKNPQMSKAKVYKKDITAIFLRRGEFEVVVSVDNLTSIKCKKINRPKWLTKLYEEIKSNVIETRTFHGIDHWENVENNAIELASQTKDCDKLICQIFALIHDSKRKTENEDPYHGLRAANYAKELFKTNKLPITQNQLNILITACSDHDKGLTTNDPTIGVCWDADRLDLLRVGIIPNKELLSTDAAKNLQWKI